MQCLLKRLGRAQSSPVPDAVADGPVASEAVIKSPPDLAAQEQQQGGRLPEQQQNSIQVQGNSDRKPDGNQGNNDRQLDDGEGINDRQRDDNEGSNNLHTGDVQASIGIQLSHELETEVELQEVEDSDDEADSTLGTDTVSSTASMTSTILQYRTLHGRRYHSEMNNLQYWAANDEQQSEVMDMNHHVLTLALGDRLFLAPLEKNKIKKVLDVGTGTGIWAIDFADEFPHAKIIGTDISPIQPSWVPPNLFFEIEDCTQEWTFKPGTFDFIHMRWLLGSIADWTELFAQAYHALQPGGWIQSLETSSHLSSDDGSVTPTSAMGQWGNFFVEGGKKLGRPFTVVEEGLQRKAMEAAGFVDITEFDFKMPLGGWPKDPVLKEMGHFAQLVLDKDIEGYVLFIANNLGWTKDEITVYVSMLRREMRSRAFHAYYLQKVVWARKPEATF